MIHVRAVTRYYRPHHMYNKEGVLINVHDNENYIRYHYLSSSYSLKVQFDEQKCRMDYILKASFLAIKTRVEKNTLYKTIEL